MRVRGAYTFFGVADMLGLELAAHYDDEHSPFQCCLGVAQLDGSVVPVQQLLPCSWSIVSHIHGMA
jgi:hypothetical protein